MGADMPEPRQLEPRVASLETSLDAVLGRVHQLDQHIGAVRTELSAQLTALATDMRHQISGIVAARQTNWAVILGAMAVLLTVIGAVGNSWITPIKESVAFSRELTDGRFGVIERDVAATVARLAANMESIAAIRGNVQVMRERFTEIETQFRWGNDVHNMRERNSDRLLRMLWAKAFGDDLPMMGMPEVGPGHNNRAAVGPPSETRSVGD